MKKKSERVNYTYWQREKGGKGGEGVKEFWVERGRGRNGGGGFQGERCSHRFRGLIDWLDVVGRNHSGQAGAQDLAHHPAFVDLQEKKKKKKKLGFNRHGRWHSFRQVFDFSSPFETEKWGGD